MVFRWLIINLGWQRTFFLAGSTLGAAMLLALYFFRSQPQDKGLTAYGEEPAPSPAEAVGTPAAPPPAHVADFGVIRRLPVFWYLVNIHFMGCVGHSILIAHIVPIAMFRGLPGLTAAGVLSTITGFSIFSRFGTPMLAERIGGKKTLMVAFLLQALPVLLLFGAQEAWQFYLFAAIFGLGFGAEMPSYPIVNRQYWGTLSPLNSIYSWQIAGAMSGMALGGWLGGVLFDITGAYTWAIAVSFVFSATGLVPIMALPRHRPGVILAPSPTTEVGTSLATAQLQDPE
ncbi:MAG: MFS transporter [Dehalococcoidia bacterium]